MLAFGQLEHQFLDEGRDVVVGAHRALPLLHAEDLFRDLDLHVLLDCDLTGQPLALAGLALVDVAGFGREDRATAFEDLDPALCAGTATAAGRTDEELRARERIQQFAADRHFDCLLVVDVDLHAAGRDQLGACAENHEHQQQHDRREEEHT